MLVRSQNVLMRRLSLDDAAFIRQDVASEMQRTTVQANDVLLNITGASIGRVATFEPMGVPANVNQHVCILRPDLDRLHHRYLMHFIAQPHFQARINSAQHGGTRQALTFSQIRDFEIPLPPLSEQKRIADILDKADAVRRKRQESIRLTEDFLRSTFLDMFGDPVKNPKGWPVRRLGDIAKLDRGRSRNRPRDLPELYGGPYPFIQTGDVANSKGMVTSYTQTYSEKGLAQSKLWSAATLVITIAANIGHTAVLTFDACFPDSMVGLIPGDDLKVEFGHFWFDAMRQRIEDAATQVAQKNINLQMLRGLEVALPPLEAQERFAEIVERSRRIEDPLECSRQQLGRLFNSLVQRAFRGEL